ncbi:2OG-Fe(II) oxygenase [Frateuria aurantia]
MSVMDLKHYVRYYDQALPASFCRQLVSSFEGSPASQSVNGRGIRAGLEHSAWTELNVSQLADDAFKGYFLQLIEQALDRYNQDIGLGIPVPMRPRIADLRIKRYRAGCDEKFEPHYDSIDQECGRYLVLLWYLNDVVEGGSTRFLDLDMEVAAREGRLLVFPPYWMFQHAGMAPVSEDKYIISTYLQFRSAKEL